MISCMEQPWVAIRSSKVTGEEFIDRCKKNQQEQIEILHRIDHVLKKIKLPPVNRTFTIDAAVQAGATIIVNEKQ